MMMNTVVESSVTNATITRAGRLARQSRAARVDYRVKNDKADFEVWCRSHNLLIEISDSDYKEPKGIAFA